MTGFESIAEHPLRLAVLRYANSSDHKNARNIARCYGQLGLTVLL